MRFLKSKLVMILVVSAILIWTIYFIPITKYTPWEINQSHEMEWIPFEWDAGFLGAHYFEKTAILVPCQIEGIPNPVTFQLDLGADLSGIYEKTYNSLLAENPEINNRIKNHRYKFLLPKESKYYADLKMFIGAFKPHCKKAFVYQDYGSDLKFYHPNDTIHLGTIGVDFFQNKVLILDYPNKKMAVNEAIPKHLEAVYIDIELDEQGRVLLPMTLNGTDFSVLFDTGSSVFQLIVPEKSISKFTNAEIRDSLEISSWGQKHYVKGRLIEDSILLAGQKFSNVKIYGNSSGYGIDNKSDAMAGNALFWDRVIVIDFKNKKFGVSRETYGVF